jgi:MinD superfamily P-loop ATPase
MEIPIDRLIAQTYSNGKLLVEELPDWKDRFVQLYEEIKNHARKS